MSENVIWLKKQVEADNEQRKDRNVAMVEAAFQFVVSHPYTDGDADEVRTGMMRGEALLLREVIDLALRLSVLGPAEFDACSGKDMAYYEHWLSHYKRQVDSFLA